MLLVFGHNHLPTQSQTLLYHIHPVVYHHTPIIQPYLSHSLNHSHPTLISTPSTCILEGWLLLQVSQSVGLTILKSDQCSAPIFHRLSFHLKKHCQDLFCLHFKITFALKQRKRQKSPTTPFSVMVGLQSTCTTSLYPWLQYGPKYAHISLASELFLITQVDLYHLCAWCTWSRENCWQAFGTPTLCD